MAAVVVRADVVRASGTLLMTTLAAFSFAAAAAQTINDPTLPPPHLRANLEGKPATQPAAPEEAPRVALILRSGQRRSAVINGRGVSEGDSLSFGGTRWRVERIDDNGVLLADGAQRRRLELFSMTGRAVQRRESK